jgi:hypothetical protein
MATAMAMPDHRKIRTVALNLRPRVLTVMVMDVMDVTMLMETTDLHLTMVISGNNISIILLSITVLSSSIIISSSSNSDSPNNSMIHTTTIHIVGIRTTNSSTISTTTTSNSSSSSSITSLYRWYRSGDHRMHLMLPQLPFKRYLLNHHQQHQKKQQLLLFLLLLLLLLLQLYRTRPITRIRTLLRTPTTYNTIKEEEEE